MSWIFGIRPPHPQGEWGTGGIAKVDSRVRAGLCMEAEEFEAAEAADRAEAKRLRATGRAAVEALVPAMRL